MVRVHVLAYYFSADDLAKITPYLDELSRTDSYIYGTVSTTDISQLRKEGILLDILEGNAEKTDEIPRSISFYGSRSLPLDIVKSTSDWDSPYYLIKVPGPLLSEWIDHLGQRGVTILERMQYNVYKVKLSNPTILEEISFIQTYRPFGNQDKDIVTARSLLGRDIFDIEKDKIALYDILLHQDQVKTPLLEYLKDKPVEIINTSGRKIRVKFEGQQWVVAIGQRPEVYAVEEYIPPKLHNDLARIQLNLDFEPIDDDNQSDLQGEGQIVGVADTGIDDQHPDLADRLQYVSALGRPGDHSDPHGHGTHVAGSIAGNGNSSQGQIKGMAPKVKLVFQSLLDSQGGIGGIPHDLAILFKEAYDQGARIHNNSWGAATESEYRFNSLEVDQFVYEHKDMLLVISAGNEGTAHQPRNSQSGFVDWLSLGSPATAKNALSVGASRSSRAQWGFSGLTYGQAWPGKYPELPIKDELVSGDPEQIAGFSSRGPCGNESRIKPDVVAPGTDIASTKSSQAPTANFWGPFPKNRKYAFMGGTSMAAPIVSGFAALVREYLVKERSHTPSAALLKAIIINGARQLGGADALADHNFTPNFHQGFGCIDMLSTLPTPIQPDLKLEFLDTWKTSEQFNSTGQRSLYSFKAEEGLPLQLCLTWTDPPGRGLQNNLNLILLHKESEIKWTGNQELPRSITAFDRDNNVEIIRIADPHAGEYWVAIQAANLIFSPQDFALALTGNLKSKLNQIS